MKMYLARKIGGKRELLIQVIGVRSNNVGDSE